MFSRFFGSGSQGVAVLIGPFLWMVSISLQSKQVSLVREHSVGFLLLWYSSFLISVMDVMLRKFVLYDARFFTSLILDVANTNAM